MVRFDLELIFAPDGIDGFTRLGTDVSMWTVSCFAILTTSSQARSHPTRAKDRESLAAIGIIFREYWRSIGKL